VRVTGFFAGLCALAVLAITTPAGAAELRVAGGGNFQKAGKPLAHAFNARAGGMAIYTSGNTGGNGMPQRLAAGEVMDVVVMPEAQVMGRERAGLIKPGTAVSFARYRMAVGVRKGAPKPDVSTPEKFRAVLLAAKTVAIPEPDPAQNSGLHMRNILMQLGIYDAVMKKAIALESRPVAAVVEGKAELSVSPLPELMEEPQADIAGPVTAALGGYTTFAIAVVASAKNDADARSFIRFVTSPEGAAVWRQNGLEPLEAAR
jgi:molybdate transport system substrate-binding protein